MKSFISKNGLWLILGTLSILFVVLFGKVFDNFVDKDGLFYWDVPVNVAVVSLRTPILNNIMLFATLMANWQIIVWGAGLGIFLLGMAKKWRYSWALIISLVIGELFTELTKTLIDRPRPPVDSAIITAAGAAFPSGHSYFAVVFYGLITYFWIKHFGKLWRKVLVAILGLGLIASIGMSRIYLGVHWTTDVLAGLSSSAVWLLLTIGYIEYKSKFFKEEEKSFNRKLVWRGFWIFTVLWLTAIVGFFVITKQRFLV